MIDKVTLKIGSNSVTAFYGKSRKTPVLLIHGNSSCKEIFSAQTEFLFRLGHTVLVPDLPGHGESEDSGTPRSTYSFPGYADVLEGLLDRLGITHCHLVGWSLGGHIGLELWFHSPIVRSLLITGTPPIRLSPAGAAAGFVDTPQMALASAPVFTHRDIHSYGSAMLGRPIDGRSRLARMIARTDGRARYWMVRNGLAGVGTDEVCAVAICPKPLAIIQGKHDPFVNIDYLQSLSYRNLWLSKPTLVHAGHAPHWRKPRLFNKFLKDFLTAID